MRLLIDTHVFIWVIANSPILPQRVELMIKSSANQIFVSAVTPWEIAIKVRAGKLTFDPQFLADFDTRIRALAFEPLAMTAAHGVDAGLLTGAHKDPFDRILVAQSKVEQMTILTKDPAIAALGAIVTW